MSVHNLPGDTPVGRLAEELIRQGRPATSVNWDRETNSVTATFAPT